LETPAVRARGQKIDEHAVTDLVLRKNENRPSLTSGAAPVAEERQGASSKNTIDRMAAAITGVKDIVLWIVNITTNTGLLVKNLNSTLRHCDEKFFFNHDIPQRKCTINPRNGNAP